MFPKYPSLPVIGGEVIGGATPPVFPPTETTGPATSPTTAPATSLVPPPTTTATPPVDPPALTVDNGGLTAPTTSNVATTALATTVPAAPGTFSQIPTWFWVLSGVAVTGVVGFAAYSAYKDAKKPAASTTASNPLPHDTRRRRRRRLSRN